MAYGIKTFEPATTQYRKKTTQKNLKAPLEKTYYLVFDAQCLQTSILQRGIGNYALNFISAVCHQRPSDSFAAVLTTIASPSDLARAKSALETLECSNLDILILDPLKNKEAASLDEAQEELLNDLESTQCQAVVLLSPIEKHDLIIPFPRSRKFKQIGVLYDLIRLQFPEKFLISRNQKTAFYWSLNNLTNSDLILSISQESKRHWVNLVSADTNIKVIYGGSGNDGNAPYKNFDERSGILCVGAELPHKNLKRLIKAYSRLSEAVQSEHRLTIVGIRSAMVRKQLFRLSRKVSGVVLIPEYLPTSELTEIYKGARLLVMPSLIEGLSLPILEAWSHRLVAVGSVSTVAQELISNDALLFDPYSEASIAACVNNLLTSETNWIQALEVSMLRAKLFTWESTANLALNAIEAIVHE